MTNICSTLTVVGGHVFDGVACQVDAVRLGVPLMSFLSAVLVGEGDVVHLAAGRDHIHLHDCKRTSRQ